MERPKTVEITHISGHEGGPWIELREKDRKLLIVKDFRPIVVGKIDRQIFFNKVWLHAMRFAEGRWDAVNGFVFDDERKQDG